MKKIYFYQAPTPKLPIAVEPPWLAIDEDGNSLPAPRLFNPKNRKPIFAPAEWYGAHPAGFTMVYVPPEAVENHEGLQRALKLNLERATEPKHYEGLLAHHRGRGE